MLQLFFSKIGTQGLKLSSLGQDEEIVQQSDDSWIVANVQMSPVLSFQVLGAVVSSIEWN